MPVDNLSAPCCVVRHKALASVSTILGPLPQLFVTDRGYASEVYLSSTDSRSPWYVNHILHLDLIFSDTMFSSSSWDSLLS